MDGHAGGEERWEVLIDGPELLRLDACESKGNIVVTIIILLCNITVQVRL